MNHSPARFHAPLSKLAPVPPSTRPPPALPIGCRRVPPLPRYAARAPAIPSPIPQWWSTRSLPADGTPADRANVQVHAARDHETAVRLLQHVALGLMLVVNFTQDFFHHVFHGGQP